MAVFRQNRGRPSYIAGKGYDLFDHAWPILSLGTLSGLFVGYLIGEYFGRKAVKDKLGYQIKLAEQRSKKISLDAKVAEKELSDRYAALESYESEVKERFDNQYQIEKITAEIEAQADRRVEKIQMEADEQIRKAKSRVTEARKNIQRLKQKSKKNVAREEEVG